MKVKDLIEGLEMCNPEAVIRLGGPEEDEVLSICALAKDNKNIWLESASINPLIKKITTRFKMVENGEMLLINVQLHKNRRTMKASCQIQATPKFNYYEE